MSTTLLGATEGKRAAPISFQYSDASITNKNNQGSEHGEIAAKKSAARAAAPFRRFATIFPVRPRSALREKKILQYLIKVNYYLNQKDELVQVKRSRRQISCSTEAGR